MIHHMIQIILIWHLQRLWLAYLLNAFEGFSYWCLSGRLRLRPSHLGSSAEVKTCLSDSRFEKPEPGCREINFETQMIQTGRSISDTTTYVICKFNRNWKNRVEPQLIFSQLEKKFCLSDHWALAEKPFRNLIILELFPVKKPMKVVHRRLSHSLFLLQILAYHNITNALF